MDEVEFSSIVVCCPLSEVGDEDFVCYCVFLFFPLIFSLLLTNVFTDKVYLCCLSSNRALLASLYHSPSGVDITSGLYVLVLCKDGLCHL